MGIMAQNGLPSFIETPIVNNKKGATAEMKQTYSKCVCF